MQHTPSTQKPEPHSDAAAQVAPRGLEHVPVAFALHTRPAAHEDVVQQAPSTQESRVPHSSVNAQSLPAAFFGRQLQLLQ